MGCGRAPCLPAGCRHACAPGRPPIAAARRQRPEAAFLRRRFCIAQDEIGLDRVGLLRDVVAIEAEPGFQAQRDRGHPGRSASPRAPPAVVLAKAAASALATRDLEPVFAGIAGARRDDVKPGGLQRRAGHEVQLGAARAPGARRPPPPWAPAAPPARGRPAPRSRSGDCRLARRWAIVGILAAGVDDHEQMVAVIAGPRRVTIRSSRMPPRCR